MNITRRNVNANGPRRQASTNQNKSDEFDTSNIEVPIQTKGKVRTAAGKVGNAIGGAAEHVTAAAGKGIVGTMVAAGVTHHTMENVMDKGATTLSDLLTHVMAENQTEEQLVKNSMRQTNAKSRPGMLPSFSSSKNDSRELDF